MEVAFHCKIYLAVAIELRWPFSGPNSEPSAGTGYATQIQRHSACLSSQLLHLRREYIYMSFR